jgi:hypothetical protein
MIAACSAVPTGPVNSTGPTLRLESVYPAPNSPITVKTVVVADLEYSVEDFLPGTYFVLAQALSDQFVRAFDQVTRQFALFFPRRLRLGFAGGQTPANRAFLLEQMGRPQAQPHRG